ncbi:hypothetical protein OROMI_026448 [Orobanche minor]
MDRTPSITGVLYGQQRLKLCGKILKHEQLLSAYKFGFCPKFGFLETIGLLRNFYILGPRSYRKPHVFLSCQSSSISRFCRRYLMGIYMVNYANKNNVSHVLYEALSLIIYAIVTTWLHGHVYDDVEEYDLNANADRRVEYYEEAQIITSPKDPDLHVDGPYFAFVPIIICLVSISRSFTGVASGATRAALTQHFALQNNAADTSDKEGSQETVATMVRMALGMLLARIAMGHSMDIWFSNYKVVGCVSLATLNCERSSILLSHYMDTGQG